MTFVYFIHNDYRVLGEQKIMLNLSEKDTVSLKFYFDLKCVESRVVADLIANNGRVIEFFSNSIGDGNSSDPSGLSDANYLTILAKPSFEQELGDLCTLATSCVSANQRDVACTNSFNYLLLSHDRR